MTNLDYLKKNAIRTREWPDGKFTMYHLNEGVAVCNNKTNSYLWYSNPQPGR
jgi:hypothetical protein